MVATACIRGEGRRKSIVHPSLGSQSKVGSGEKNQAEDCPLGTVLGNKLRIMVYFLCIYNRPGVAGAVLYTPFFQNL